MLDEGDNWMLNGSKIFITNAGYANVFIIIAITGTVLDKRGRKSKEISAFIVERTDPGFSVGKHEKKMGIRGSSTCELIMEDCIIPKDRLLGKQGKGFATGHEDAGRRPHRHCGPGPGHRRGRHGGDRRLRQGAHPVRPSHRRFQNTQFELADMHTRMEAAKYLVYAAAMKKQAQNGARFATPWTRPWPS